MSFASPFLNARLVLVLLLLASTGLYACSSSDSVAPRPVAAVSDASLNEGDDPGDDPLDAGPPTSCTVPRGGKTGVKKCDDCLQASCCGVIRECIDDTDCKNLTDCFYDCAAKYPRTSDAGAQCVNTCTKEHARVAQTFTSMLECQNAECKSPCTQ
jgi:hypothetical protein